MLLYRKEPSFIQTCRSSLESQVLDFTHANKDQVYWISSCQQFQHTLCHFYHNFLKKKQKHPWHLNHFQWGRSRNNSRTYICHPFFSALHIVSADLLYFKKKKKNMVPGCHLTVTWLEVNYHVTGSHVIVTSPVKLPHIIGKIRVKMPSKSRQNQGSNGFSSRGTPL